MSCRHFFRCSALQAARAQGSKPVPREYCHAVYHSLPFPCTALLCGLLALDPPSWSAHRGSFIAAIPCFGLSIPWPPRTDFAPQETAAPIFFSELFRPEKLSHELFLLCQAGAELLLCMWLRDELISLISLEMALLRGCKETGLSGWKQTGLQGIPQLSGAVCMGSWTSGVPLARTVPRLSLLLVCVCAWDKLAEIWRLVL